MGEIIIFNISSRSVFSGIPPKNHLQSSLQLGTALPHGFLPQEEQKGSLQTSSTAKHFEAPIVPAPRPASQQRMTTRLKDPTRRTKKPFECNSCCDFGFDFGLFVSCFGLFFCLLPKRRWRVDCPFLRSQLPSLQLEENVCHVFWQESRGESDKKWRVRKEVASVAQMPSQPKSFNIWKGLVLIVPSLRF